MLQLESLEVTKLICFIHLKLESKIAFLVICVSLSISFNSFVPLVFSMI